MARSTIKKLRDFLEISPEKTENGWVLEGVDGIIYTLNSSYNGPSKVVSKGGDAEYKSGFSKRMGCRDTVTIEYSPDKKLLLWDYFRTRPASAIAYPLVVTSLVTSIYSAITGAPIDDPVNAYIALMAMYGGLSFGAKRNLPKIENARIKKAAGKLGEVYEKLKKASDNEN